MATSVYFNNQGASREQLLLEDMIIESIRNHGIDVYYIPRQSRSSVDELFGDDPVKAFLSAYPLDVYLETYSDFEGNQEFFSKFGLEVQKIAKVIIARRTFERFLPTATRAAPKEGDLIWLPTLRKLMEITFVEQEKNFFQLGRGGGSRSGSGIEQLGKTMPYMYGISLEMFKYNGEFFNTGIIAIDEIQDLHSYQVEYTVQSGGLGTYEEHEIVYQGTSLANATVKAYVTTWDKPNRKLRLRNIDGEFTTNNVIYGVNSDARWTLVSGNTLENAADAIEDNNLVEQEATNIIDFTEINPFGEP